MRVKKELRNRINRLLSGNKAKRFFALLGVILLTLTLSSGEAYAQPGLVLSTPYPGITVRAGQEISFPLGIRNAGTSPKVVDLAVASIPEGWESTLEGKGEIIHQVFVDSGSSEKVNLKVKIPSDTPEGDYKIVVEANANGIKDRLTLSLKVRENFGGGSKLIAEYPELQGSGSTLFKFRIDITNNSAETQSYSLGAKVPRGWSVNFSPAYTSKQIASISVEPNSSEGLEVEINPPQQVKAGEYTIPVTAISADETLSADLKVVIKGTYDIQLTTPTGRLNVETYAGKKKGVTLLVMNNGSADLKDVSFSSWEPQNWSVTFEPEELDVLPAGESREVKAYIEPDGKAIAGDYVVKLTARTPETSSSAEFRVMVKTSTVWGLVGVVIIAGLGYGIYWIFKEYGRR